MTNFPIAKQITIANFVSFFWAMYIISNLFSFFFFPISRISRLTTF